MKVLCRRESQIPSDLPLSFLDEAHNLYLGACGLMVGGFRGIIVSQSPARFSIASGIKSFCLGSGFWCELGRNNTQCQSFSQFLDFRSALVRKHEDQGVSGVQQLKYSAIAGSLTGAINGAFRKDPYTPILSGSHIVKTPSPTLSQGPL